MNLRRPVVPIKVGGESFDLWSLDTNVLSEILRSRTGLRPFLIPHSVSKRAVICVSPWVVLEVRKRPALYREFLELFSVVPLGLLRSPMDIVEEELKAYPTPSVVSPLLGIFSYMAEDPGWRDPKAFFDRLFWQAEVNAAEKNWAQQWRQSALDSMLRLRRNFPPPKAGYTARDSIRFADLGVVQSIIQAYPDWSTATIRAHSDIDAQAFPALRMMFHIVFFRFYLERRDPELQDVFDILIHASAPYVDLSMTEAFQTDIHAKVSRTDPALGPLASVSLRQVREWKASA